MYSVDWVESAINDLTRLWVQSDPTVQRTITLAANQIDKDLQGSPSEIGESRDGDNRVYFVAPLGVVFRVDEAAKSAVVLDVWLVRPRKKS